jgi:hypothetical protein
MQDLGPLPRDAHPAPTPFGHSAPDDPGRNSTTITERISWEVCPRCGGPAAVGWVDGTAVEFDCLRGCELPEKRIRDTPWRGQSVIL